MHNEPTGVLGLKLTLFGTRSDELWSNYCTVICNVFFFELHYLVHLTAFDLLHTLSTLYSASLGFQRPPPLLQIICGIILLYLQSFMDGCYSTSDDVSCSCQEIITEVFVSPAKHSDTCGSLCPSSVCLSVRLSVCLSVRLSVCPSVTLA